MLREAPLHASLKEWYTQPGDRTETPVGSYVVDIVRGDLLIEIQTRSFAKMRSKLTKLLDNGHRVRIVHPIPVDNWIVKIEDDGTIVSRRRSPKHGQPVDVFSELVAFPQLAAHEALEIELVMTTQEVLRRHEPGKAWRRKGWVVAERRLIEVETTVRLSSVDDMTALLPTDLPSPFTTRDLASELKRPMRTAQQMAYCLRKMGAITEVGKRGNAIEYLTEPS